MRSRPSLLRTSFIGALGCLALCTLVLAAASFRSAIRGESFLKYHLIHPFHEVDGVSKEVDCRVEVDDATGAIRSASFSADVSTFDSGNSNRDSHALEVLDALTYPMVSFQSTDVVTTGHDLRVSGNLTFHGRTHPIAFPATVDSNASKLTVRGTATVSLTAFEIERPSLLMIPVRDSLEISFAMVFPLNGRDQR